MQIKNDYILTNGTQKSFLKYDTSTGQYSLYTALENTPVDYEDKLHLQIGFILLKINPNIKLMKNLDFLNKKIRNKLYLTHGKDSSSPNFAVEYKDQRKLNKEWEIHISELFEIVYFLCTGKECDWNTNNLPNAHL